MGEFIRCQVVIVPFPFSDLTDQKRRPALVIASLHGDDVILCQITSKDRDDGYGIQLSNSDFIRGGLDRSSVIRPNHLFTASSGLIIRAAGTIREAKMEEVIRKLLEIIGAR